MSKIKSWANKLSVRKKLIFYGYLTITPVLLITCTVLLFYNYQRGLKEHLENDMMEIKSLEDSVQLLQKDVEDISTYICINNEILRILEAQDAQELNQNPQLWLEMAPMRIVQDMISLKGHIKTIALYPENGVYPYLRGMDGSSYIDDFSKIRKLKAYKEVLKSENKKIWKSAYKGEESPYSVNHSDKIMLYREIFNLSRTRKLGFIAIGVEKNSFEELYSNVPVSEEEGIIVLDKNGGQLFEMGKIPEDFKTKILTEEFLKKDYREREEHFTYGEYEIICKQASRDSSILCKIEPNYSMQMEFFDFAYMPLTLLLAILVGMLPLLLIISHLITSPLNKVSVAIRKFSKGDFNQKIEVNTEDEIGEVATCFNKMVEDIRTLIEENYVITLKEKESELSALQAQINPHFLYNTLDTFYWKASEDGNEELADNIIALSQLFRLVLNQGDSEITVENEVELVSRYLQIQRMRFVKRLEYFIDIDEEIKKEKIPKLIVQPFVENAVVHGLENMSTCCQVKVTGKMEENMIHFEIEDTGIGMSQSQIDAIWQNDTESKDYSRQRIGRYAIKNIKERLELKYQENFTLQIESSVGKGTRVILCIPHQEI